MPGISYGSTVISGLSSSSVVLSSLQAAKDRIVLTGNLTSSIQLILPAWVKGWSIINNCTGNYSVICKTAAGSGVVVKTGYTARVYGDGVNIYKDQGDAAQYDVGNGNGQIPDMSLFGFSGNYFKQPNGWITQMFSLELPSGVTQGNVSFPVPFPSRCAGAVASGASTVGFSLNPGVMTFNISSSTVLAWRRYGSTDASSLTVIAMGF